MSADTFVIENNTAAFIYLFGTPTFPSGIRLIPGVNNVPRLFMDEFQEHSSMTESRPGKPGVLRYPGREQLEQLQEAVEYHTTDGRRQGPRITIFTQDQAGRPEGPMAPLDLKSYKDEAALTVIKVTEDKAALRRWSKDTRKEVAQAASVKLSGIGA